MNKSSTSCQQCDALNTEDESITDKRWVLSDATQVCIWASPSAIPEVDFLGAEQIQSYYCCAEHALDGVRQHLDLLGATAQWSDVRTNEVCSCCGVDLDTTKWHKVLSLIVEEGPLYDPVTLEAEYAARFCNKCAPVNASDIEVVA
jgi:hypothetical protein